MANTRGNKKDAEPKLRVNRSRMYNERRGALWAVKDAHKHIEKKWKTRTSEFTPYWVHDILAKHTLATINVSGDSVLSFFRIKTDSNAVKRILSTQFKGVNPATLPRAPVTGRLNYALEKTDATPEGLPPSLVMRFERVITDRVNKLVVDAWDKVLEAGLTFPHADPNRSATPALHLGSWSINQSAPQITAHSRAPTQTQEAQDAIDKFLQIINTEVAPRITTFFKNNFPAQYARQERYVSNGYSCVFILTLYLVHTRRSRTN